MITNEHDLYQVAVKAFIRNSDGKVLVLKALRNSTLGGFYDIPGGRIHRSEFGTSLIEILKREIVEETGIQNVTMDSRPVAVGRHSMTYDSSGKFPEIHLLYLFFEARFDGGDVHISHEHEGFEWVNLASTDLPRYFTSGILDAVRQYIALVG